MITMDYAVSDELRSTQPQIVFEQRSRTHAAEMKVGGVDGIKASEVVSVGSLPGTKIESAEQPTVKIFEGQRAWDNADEKKFYKLALKHSRNALERDEELEFVTLQSRRRATRNPRAIEDILFEYKRELLLRHLEDSLQAYVKFIKA